MKILYFHPSLLISALQQHLTAANTTRHAGSAGDGQIEAPIPRGRNTSLLARECVHACVRATHEYRRRRTQNKTDRISAIGYRVAAVAVLL